MLNKSLYVSYLTEWVDNFVKFQKDCLCIWLKMLMWTWNLFTFTENEGSAGARTQDLLRVKQTW